MFLSTGSKVKYLLGKLSACYLEPLDLRSEDYYEESIFLDVFFDISVYLDWFVGKLFMLLKLRRKVEFRRYDSKLLGSFW